MTRSHLMNPRGRADDARGYSLLEVLVALVLVSIALLGLAGLQIRAQQVEVEAYQRSQAMLLVNDMINRIAVNRDDDIWEQCYALSDSATGTPFLGTGSGAIPACPAGVGAQADLADADMAAWDDLLEGASETVGGNNVGGLAGARGCIYFDIGPPKAVTVAVAWQGEAESGAPADNCATGLYGDESLRRVVNDTLSFAELG